MFLSPPQKHTQGPVLPKSMITQTCNTPPMLRNSLELYVSGHLAQKCWGGGWPTAVASVWRDALGGGRGGGRPHRGRASLEKSNRDTCHLCSARSHNTSYITCIYFVGITFILGSTGMLCWILHESCPARSPCKLSWSYASTRSESLPLYRLHPISKPKAS